LIRNLVRLRFIRLAGNDFEMFPDSLCNLTQLQSLDLSCNQLGMLPESLCNLTQLQSIYLSNNELTILPESISRLEKLEVLHLGYNYLTSLPQSLLDLTQLRQLSLGHNKFQELPDWLGRFTRLQRLGLSCMELTSLPKSLGDLQELEYLYLGSRETIGFWSYSDDPLSNRLSASPGSIFKLNKLKVLGLDQNQITDLPVNLLKLENLKELDLRRNPLNPELAAAYEEGLEGVRAYLRAKAEGEIVLNEAKLILVGEGEVGKTSLLSALRGEDWIENRPTTHGVEIDIKPLTLTDPDSQTQITLNGWDFGGQNIYRHTHQLFFTAPAIYLAVWNPRRGPTQCRVEEWLKMVKHRAYDETRPHQRPRILIVATHGGPKQRLDHIDEQTLQEEFGALIVGFHQVDSKTAYGLAELKQIIAHTAAQIPQVGRTVPASWKRVLDALRERSQTDAWVTYEQYQTLCGDQGVDLPLAKTYAAILNELGHLIHYNTDPLLKETLILKPEWLSKAISFILEDQQVKDQNGLVRHRRLGELWDDPARGPDRYPSHLHSLFIKLMQRCDLSYQVELPDADAEPTSLMAQLVPTGRPPDWQEYWPPNWQQDQQQDGHQDRQQDRQQQTGNQERTQICRILDAETGRTAEAEGLMYRLIVRLHRYSLGRDNYYHSRHWKNGLLLDDGFNGRAFLEQIAGDIYITVRAAYPNGFLGHLCAEVQWLVKSFWKGLDPRLYVPCPTPNCKGLLERDEMLEFKSQGMPKVRCAVCRQFHDIDPLMAAPVTKPQWQEAVRELKQGQANILNTVDTGFDSLSVQLRTLMSQADEQFRALLQTLTDPAKDGPRLFSLEPINPGFFDKPNWIAQKVRVTLWCEHSRLPLTVLNNDHRSGVYTIDLSRDWLKRAAPVLRMLSLTLKLALPLAIPGTKLATDEQEYGVIAEQLDFGIKSANAFVASSEKIGDWLIEGDSTNPDPASLHTQAVIRAQGGVLRELHTLLEQKDPDFGGLVRVQNKRREFLWVHPQFVQDYD
jgi:hypothetical protein